MLFLDSSRFVTTVDYTGHLYKTDNSWGVSWNDCREQHAPDKFKTDEEARIAGDKFISGNSSCSYIVVDVD